MISFVLLLLRSRLFAEPHPAKFRTSSLYANSSTSCMRPTIVISSANLMIVLDGWVGVQLCTYRVNRMRGLSMQPCGDPVLRAWADEQKGHIFIPSSIAAFLGFTVDSVHFTFSEE